MRYVKTSTSANFPGTNITYTQIQHNTSNFLTGKKSDVLTWFCTDQLDQGNKCAGM